MCSGRCESGLALRRASAGGWGVFLRYLRSEVFHFLVPLLELLRHTERAQLLDLANHLVHYSLDLLALGGRNPFQAHALLFDAYVLEHPLQHLEAAEHLVVAFRVMAIPGMAAADEHAVSMTKNTKKTKKPTKKTARRKRTVPPALAANAARVAAGLPPLDSKGKPRPMRKRKRAKPAQRKR